MTLANLEHLDVGTYKTKILSEIEQDNISDLSDNRFIYLVRYAEDELLAKRRIKKQINEAITKKKNMFYSLKNRFKIFSLANDINGMYRFHRGYETEEVVFLPCFSGFLSNIINNICASWSLFKYRNNYDNVLIYNTYYAYLLPVLVLKFILKKKIYIDFEDDYLLRDTFLLTKITFNLVKHVIDGGVVINRNMLKYFPGRRMLVFNSFADFSYMDALLIKTYDHFTLLYSGSLDDIRGADLIPELSRQLLSKKIKHTIYVTGKGPREAYVKNYAGGNENIIFEGFVSEQRLQELLNICDVGLVLQKPDHPFSLGSFPSKVDMYAEHTLPVLCLESSDIGT